MPSLVGHRAGKLIANVSRVHDSPPQGLPTVHRILSNPAAHVRRSSSLKALLLPSWLSSTGITLPRSAACGAPRRYQVEARSSAQQHYPDPVRNRGHMTWMRRANRSDMNVSSHCTSPRCIHHARERRNHTLPPHATYPCARTHLLHIERIASCLDAIDTCISPLPVRSIYCAPRDASWRCAWGMQCSEEQAGIDPQHTRHNPSDTRERER